MGIVIESKDAEHGPTGQSLCGKYVGLDQIRLHKKRSDVYELRATARYFVDREKAELKGLRHLVQTTIAEKDLGTNLYAHLYAQLKSRFGETSDVL